MWPVDKYMFNYKTDPSTKTDSLNAMSKCGSINNFQNQCVCSTVTRFPLTQVTIPNEGTTKNLEVLSFK